MNAATNPIKSTQEKGASEKQGAPYAIDTEDLNLWYGNFQALFDVNLKIRSNHITSLIGPSGCGKSTFLRSVNRINERLGYVRIEGRINVLEQNIYDPGVELVQVRKQIGMVFQRPNPLPLPIRENVLFGHKIHNTTKKGRQAEEDEVVEQALRQVLLLDEPCSALDPKGTEAVEELIWELSGQYTILIVTHNMAQARRASEECIFMLMGKVVEHKATEDLFIAPDKQETADYIEGRYG